MIPDIELCRMSGGVYSDALITGEVAELEYQLCPRDEEMVIVVRGTQIASWTDVMRDMWAFPKKHPVIGRGHAGFIMGADALFRDISPKLNKGVELVLTGHSLGAIESMMLAMLLHDAGYPVRRWVGFGTPKGLLTNKELGFPGLMYKHRGDVVTMIPTWPYRNPVGVEVKGLGRRWRPSVIDHRIDAGYLAAMMAA